MKVLAFDIGIRNLSFCLIDDNNILKWEVVDLAGKDFKTTSKNIIQFLLEEFPMIDFNKVLVENQPCNKNPIMKSIQMIVYSYFEILNLQTSAECDVQLVSASMKLKVRKNTITQKLSYADKKKKSIELTLLYIKDHWRERFLTAKKKDDLADAFLYCVSYLETIASSNVSQVFC